MPAEERVQFAAAGSAAEGRPGTGPDHGRHLEPTPPAQLGLALEAQLQQVGLA